MTSGTGESLRQLRSPLRNSGDTRTRGWKRASGFTLVEIMVVMAIVVMLFGLVAVSLSQYIGKAAKSRTQGLILRLEQYLDQYKSLTGHYPPDGIDSTVKTETGEQLVGSACLYYFLTRPVIEARKVGGKLTKREHPPIATFQDKMEVAPEDPDHPGVRELVDGWGTPVHYDNTENGVFQPQGGEVHTPPLEDEEHPPDPREGNVIVDGRPSVSKPGIQSGGFDIWSHGEQGHDVSLAPSMPIASWNKE